MSNRPKDLKNVELPNVQAKMLEVLSDGEPHLKKELYACLYDDLGEGSNIFHHICMIRKKIKDKGYIITIMFSKKRETQYVLSRSISTNGN